MTGQIVGKVKIYNFFWNFLEDMVKIKIPSEILPPLSDQIGGSRLENRTNQAQQCIGSILLLRTSQ